MTSAGVALYSESCCLSNSMITEAATPASRYPRCPPSRPRRRRPSASLIDYATALKVVRGARLPDGRQVHLLSAYDTATGVVLAQVTIAAKTNEIPAFTPLLDQV